MATAGFGTSATEANRSPATAAPRLVQRPARHPSGACAASPRPRRVRWRRPPPSAHGPPGWRLCSREAVCGWLFTPWTQPRITGPDCPSSSGHGLAEPGHGVGPGRTGSYLGTVQARDMWGGSRPGSRNSHCVAKVCRSAESACGSAAGVSRVRRNSGSERRNIQSAPAANVTRRSQ